MFTKKSRSASGGHASRRGGSTVVPRRRTPQEGESLVSKPASATPQFRRNQTLSGYRSAADTAGEASSRQKAHHLVMQRRRLGLFFTVAAAVAVVMILILWQLMARVQVVTSSQQLSRSFDSSVYEAAVMDYLMANPAERLRFSLDEASLTEFVATDLPEVEFVKLGHPMGVAKSSLTVTFRKPVAGWQINSRQLYVDSKGVVFEKNYYDTPGVQIVDESGVSPEQGGAVVGSRLLGFLGRVVSEAQGRGYTAEKAVLPAGLTRQIDVHFKDVSTRVKFSIDRGAGEQVEDAVRSLEFLKTRGETPGYLDVRVSGRAAYR